MAYLNTLLADATCALGTPISHIETDDIVGSGFDAWKKSATDTQGDPKIPKKKAQTAHVFYQIFQR